MFSSVRTPIPRQVFIISILFYWHHKTKIVTNKEYTTTISRSLDHVAVPCFHPVRSKELSTHHGGINRPRRIYHRWPRSATNQPTRPRTAEPIETATPSDQPSRAGWSQHGLQSCMEFRTRPGLRIRDVGQTSSPRRQPTSLRGTLLGRTRIHLQVRVVNKRRKLVAKKYLLCQSYFMHRGVTRGPKQRGIPTSKGKVITRTI